MGRTARLCNRTGCKCAASGDATCRWKRDGLRGRHHPQEAKPQRSAIGLECWGGASGRASLPWEHVGCKHLDSDGALHESCLLELFHEATAVAEDSARESAVAVHSDDEPIAWTCGKR